MFWDSANTTAAQKLVQSTLTAKGINITTQGELTGEQIDKGKSDSIFLVVDESYNKDCRLFLSQIC
jgi:hypothetical protein